MNQLTHVVDGSMIYGSDDDRAKHLREFKRGLLKYSIVNNAEFLPFDNESRSDECVIPRARERGLQCFVGGMRRKLST